MEVIRSHRRPWERLLFFLKPYRCNDCQRRFYILSIPTLPGRAL